MVTKRLKPVPVEAIARGYLIGSGWKDYQRTGAVSGITLPDGLRQAEKLPEPIFTPSTKAAVGDHDENIDFDTMVKAVGAELAERVRDATLRIYRFAAEYAAQRGILLADTKFEFGTDADGRLYVMDEMLTPDSSRYWPADEYEVGTSPPSYDKQFVRDYLETLDWNKTAPGPALPAEVIERTRAKYAEALQKLAGFPSTDAPVAMNPGYLYLTVAIVAEVIATSALKASKGFTRPAPRWCWWAMALPSTSCRWCSRPSRWALPMRSGRAPASC